MVLCHCRAGVFRTTLFLRPPALASSVGLSRLAWKSLGDRSSCWVPLLGVGRKSWPFALPSTCKRVAAFKPGQQICRALYCPEGLQGLLRELPAKTEALRQEKYAGALECHGSWCCCCFSWRCCVPQAMLACSVCSGKGLSPYCLCTCSLHANTRRLGASSWSRPG